MHIATEDSDVQHSSPFLHICSNPGSCAAAGQPQPADAAAAWLRSHIAGKGSTAATFGATLRSFCSEHRLFDQLVACSPAAAKLTDAFVYATGASSASVGRICLTGWLKQAQDLVDETSEAGFVVHQILVQLEEVADLITEV